MQHETPKQALFTDIDDTLIARGKNAALLKAAHDLHARLATQNTALILVTGAPFSTVRERITAGEIPLPDAIIAAVGTDIWRRNSKKWERDEHYAAMMQATGFNKSEVTLMAGRFIRESRSWYELSFQPEPADEPYKVSLHFMADQDDATTLFQRAKKFFAPFKVVSCQEIHFNATLPEGTMVQKYCLDILPATKADAVNYLIAAMDIRGGFKAGDSGNDIDMLLNPDPLVPVLVGGHKPEAEAAVRQELSHSNGLVGTLKDGRTMYLETGTRRAAESLLHAMQLFNRTVDGNVALEGSQ